MDSIIDIGNSALLLVLMVSAIPVVVATVVGLLVGLLQTVTQLQEQTLPFGAKMLAVVVALLLMLGWMSQALLDFGRLAMTRALTV